VRTDASFWRPPFGFRPTSPHPAVVQIVAAARGSQAQGSGTLVGIHDRYGVVITNWHVVRDATGDISVAFPDGFRSVARVLKVDSEWDLAALLIWRPQVQAIPIATVAPRPGDLLTIAGYGPGRYRAATGRCTQYVAPGANRPYEMVELATAARQGDSGGPIFNERGELAGVLFGSSGGTTSGSYCGRVSRFLDTVWPPTNGYDSTIIAERPPDPLDAAWPQPVENGPAHGNTIAGAVRSIQTDLPTDDVVALNSGIDLTPPDEPIEWRQWTGDTPFEQSKSFLAGIGLLTVIVHFSKVLFGGDNKAKR